MHNLEEAAFSIVREAVGIKREIYMVAFFPHSIRELLPFDTIGTSICGPLLTLFPV